jgi:shikimate kinase
MINMDNIYLVGFMGTGKSSVGRELAKREKWEFIDLDELIEKREKRSIAEIFAKQKEPYFRQLEKQILKETSGRNNCVVACGGGIVMDKDNIDLMKKTGIMVCLAASPEVILKRTSQARHRPLLEVENHKERIKLLLNARAPYYALADSTIDTSRISVGGVTDKIIQLIAKRR